MMDTFSNLLQAIAACLLVPDVLLLLGLFGATILWAGGFAAEAVERWRRRGAFAARLRRLRQHPERAGALREWSAGFGLPRRAFEELAHTRSADKLVDDLHLRAERALRILHLGIRLGPMLGLIGTLIPLGPALRGMAAGDLHRLSGQLIIAFACPVVGIACGGACFLMHSVRQQWYQQDLSDVEFVLACCQAPADGAANATQPAAAESAAELV